MDAITEQSGQTPTEPALAARIGRMLFMGDIYAKRWIAGFAQAGGTSVYAAIRSDRLLAPAGCHPVDHCGGGGVQS